VRTKFQSRLRREGQPRSKVIALHRFRTLLFYVVLVAVWGVVAKLHIWDASLLPSPWQVVETLYQLIRDRTMPDAIAVSLRRVLIGYVISLVVGVPLGIVLARKRFWADTVGSLVAGIQALPSICWLPLALLWFGLNDRAILFVVVMGSFVSIAVTVEDGVKSLPPTYVRAARTMGTSGWRMYSEVLLPASLPSILTGAKQGWSYAWRALMAGELLFVSLGLGHLLMMGRELADMSEVLSVMIVIVALGLFVDRFFFGALERVVGDRWGFERAA
jgi:NitT/TauT family transport system permease protein